jgi:hypothetical protein
MRCFILTLVGSNYSVAPASVNDVISKLAGGVVGHGWSLAAPQGFEPR